VAFLRACTLDEVDNASPMAVTVDGVDLAIVVQGDEVYAIYDECSHAAIPLSEGEVEDGEIECWLHGSRFDLRTGKPSGPPATEPVPTYPVRVEGGDILVDVSSPNPTD
jgi:3-phenylpropionate/trans-cinnamate dioxygenase ferredoxin component